MKIGILTYNTACNFGANLQALSTYWYLKNSGNDPVFITWIPEDLEQYYKISTPKEQYVMYDLFRKTNWVESEICRTTHDVCNVIIKENIEAVIIGSDAVSQYHTILERVVFPTRRLFSVLYQTKDKKFPNPFWGDFNEYLDRPVPVAAMSISSQDSVFKYYSKSLRIRMYKLINTHKYISVRDEWTQKQINYISFGEINPMITPDPVFALNDNLGSLLEGEESFKARYAINRPYLLLSFKDSRTVTQEWINSFEKIVSAAGYDCIILPFSDRSSFGTCKRVIKHPLSPLDWYLFIKYSSGYIGHNMHPIIVSLSNNIPFFSFDTYGIKRLNGLITNDSSSKIKHILNAATLTYNRISCLHRSFVAPTPQSVFDKVVLFDFDKSSNFVDYYLLLYKKMMSDILNSFKI